MVIRTKLTAQGQVSVPAEIRRRLGIGPGATLEWEEVDDAIVVRRAGRHTSEDVHRTLFGSNPPKPRTIEELDEAIRDHVRRKHAGS
jgi:antitoxin PrlF